MKYKGLIISAIIAILAVIFFLVMIIVVGIKSYTGSGLGINEIMKSSNNIICEQEFSIEGVDFITIKSDAGNVKIKENKGDKIRVVLYGEHEKDARVSQDDGVLSIDNTHKRLRLFNAGTTKKDIEVFIPSKYKQKIKIDVDYGDCVVTDLPKASLEVECDAGNVKVGVIKDAHIKCDMGNVTIKEVLDMCDIKVDCGNGEIEQLSIKRNSYMSVNLGNAVINKCENVYIDADVDLGENQVNNNDRKSDITMKIEVDCGNINVN